MLSGTLFRSDLPGYRFTSRRPLSRPRNLNLNILHYLLPTNCWNYSTIQSTRMGTSIGKPALQEADNWAVKVCSEQNQLSWTLITFVNMQGYPLTCFSPGIFWKNAEHESVAIEPKPPSARASRDPQALTRRLWKGPQCQVNRFVVLSQRFLIWK